MNALGQHAGGPGQHIILVGFQDQDNLGLRYLISAVAAAGHTAEIITYDSNPEALLRKVQAERPDLVGFSLIFQYMAPSFGKVIAALREAGITAHITMGGHYPSFDYGEVLERMPGLDSIIRYEGEATVVELLDHLAAGRDWRGIDGIAFRLDDGRVQANRMREPIADLDLLPWPERTDIDYESAPLPTASLLGSRGCPWNCSFCSIRPFYEAQGGRLRRLRRASAVVDEMIDLVEHRNVTVFLFQDDDFLATGRRAREWACAIADDIVARGYGGRIAFKMSCRSDEIDEETLKRLIRGGLTHVYMGVESGDEIGLANMNKMLNPEAHHRAGRILKSLGLSFDFGFMLMDPWSTFASVRNNIAFLERFVGDGWSVAPFCRMLPYAGTPMKRQLEQEGRLLGTSFEPDYKFLDPKLDLFYDWMLATFHRRNFTSQGLCHLLRYGLFEARLRHPRANPATNEDRAALQFIASVCNRQACNSLRAALDHVESRPLVELQSDRDFLASIMALEQREEARLEMEFNMYHRMRAGSPTPTRDTSFDKTWTLWQGDREAAGIGVA